MQPNAEGTSCKSMVGSERYNVDDADAEKKNSSNFLVKWIMLASRGKYNIVLMWKCLANLPHCEYLSAGHLTPKRSQAIQVEVRKQQHGSAEREE